MRTLLGNKKTRKTIYIIILVIIGIPFVFFGSASLLTRSGGPQYAGEIFGKKIATEDYLKAYNQTQIQAIMQYGDNFNKIKQFLDLESQTWDRIIILKEAQKRKIQISDKEVVATIEKYPFFQRNGQFDNSLYNDILSYVFQTKARDFEEATRDNLKIMKVFETETSKVTVKDEDVLDAFKKQNEQVQISYALIAPEQFKSQATFDEKEAEQYYTDHKNEFFMPPTIQVQYVKLEFPVSPKKDDDEKSPVTEALKSAVKDEATAIYKDLIVAKDITKVASDKKLNLQTTGFFSLVEPDMSLGFPYDVLNKLFTQTAGQITEPFETTTGMVIAVVKAKKEAYVPEYAEIKDKVKDAILLKNARSIAKAKADESFDKLKKAWDSATAKEFATIAKSVSLEITQTPNFHRGEYLPKIGLAKEFQDAAFTLSDKNPLSGVIESANGYFILHLDKYTPMDTAEFAKQKETFKENLLNENKNKAFTDFLTKLRLAANLTNTISSKKEPKS